MPTEKERKIMNEAITNIHHVKRHRELHAALDELLADFMMHSKGPITGKTISELLRWSRTQTINPDKNISSGHIWKE